MDERTGLYKVTVEFAVIMPETANNDRVVNQILSEFYYRFKNKGKEKMQEEYMGLGFKEIMKAMGKRSCMMNEEIVKKYLNATIDFGGPESPSMCYLLITAGGEELSDPIILEYSVNLSNELTE